MERFIRVIKARGETVVVYTKGKYEDTTAGEMRSDDIRNVMKRLHEYEDTGLTPPEIMGKMEALRIYKEQGLTPDQIAWLKDRDTEYFCKTSIFDHESVVCKCGNDIEKDSGFKFCPYCGNRIKLEE